MLRSEVHGNFETHNRRQPLKRISHCAKRIVPFQNIKETRLPRHRRLRSIAEALNQAEPMDAPDRCSTLNNSSCAAGVVHTRTITAAVWRNYAGAGVVPRYQVRRKRHTAAKTNGRLLMINLATADISDSARAQTILGGIRRRWSWRKHLFPDGPHDRLELMDKSSYLESVIEVIRRIDQQQAFKLRPRR